MADVMTFPETFDEFAEQYKIVDKKEVYTNGTELIPIFRVKQWLEDRPATKLTECKEDTSERLVCTGQILESKKNGRIYEVVIADNNVFVLCPWKYSRKEGCMIVKYSKASIYANQKSINTLDDLDFALITPNKK